MTNWTQRHFLILTLLLFIGATPASLSAFTFGYTGQDGTDGRDGMSGLSTSDQVVFATGSNQSITLRGTDGEDGEDGRDGEDAWSCHQPYNPEYDLQGADGGDGGRAGRGGSGGNSGSLTFYYQDRANLKPIHIDMIPGNGGKSGRSGYGGRGCRCSQSFWTVQNCTTHHDANGNPITNCSNDYYRCWEGRDGNNGSNALDGFDGYMGTLQLVNQTNILEPVYPTQKISLAGLGLANVELSTYSWSQHYGAELLFSPGSTVPSTYYVYEKTIRKGVGFRWDAQRPASDFIDHYVTLHLNEEQVSATFSSQLWIKSHQEVNPDQVTVVISNLMRESEVKQLSLTEITGNGIDLIATLEDQAPVTDLLTTSFTIKYFVKGVWAYNSKFIGSVPSELVTQDGNKLTIAVGKLPIAAKWFNPGKKIRIRLDVTRGFAERELSFELVNNHTISKTSN